VLLFVNDGVWTLMTEKDVQAVASFLREQYGRTIEHIGTPTEIATGFLEAVVEAGRLGDSEPASEGWEPHPQDVEDFTHAGVGGMVRLWRAEEIAHYALIGLARAGRLLPRPDAALGAPARVEVPCDCASCRMHRPVGDRA
jgi:hypothetical protein